MENKYSFVGKECIVRGSVECGTYFGTLLEESCGTTKLKNAIRINYWEGAASLAQLAVDGPQIPEKCIFIHAPNGGVVTMPHPVSLFSVTEVAANIIKRVADGREEEPEYWCLVESPTSGIYIGNLKEKTKDSVVLSNVRWLWKWAANGGLEELAKSGTNRPKECKFPLEVPMMKIYDVDKITRITVEALQSIDEVPVWRTPRRFRSDENMICLTDDDEKNREK